MIDRSGEDQPVLGDPPLPPEEIWQRALDRALDPWATPDADLVPADDTDPPVATTELRAGDEDDDAADDPHDHAPESVVDTHENPVDAHESAHQGTHTYDEGPVSPPAAVDAPLTDP